MLKFLEQTVYGQPHDVVVASVYAGYRHRPDPFLYAVGAGFVEGLIVVDVEADLLLGKRIESYVSHR